MPNYPHIERYHEELQRLKDFGGSDNEGSIRRAFENCLDAYCREHRERLALVAELDATHRSVPDGTVKDTLRMARGYWEAKDTHDDLDTEIQRKFNRGYPRDNIIFEDSQTAVLIQNREEAMRVDMTRPGELHRLIRSFLDYELPQIEEFRQSQQQFKADLPTVLANLREALDTAESDNPTYRAAAAAFLDLCQQTISREVSAADVREMLLQHILTKDIFLRVFSEDQFHRENNVAQHLDALEGTFFTGDVRRQAIETVSALITGPLAGLPTILPTTPKNSSSSRPSTRTSTKPTTPPPPTAWVWFTRQMRSSTLSSAALTPCCNGTSAAAWPTTTCKSSTPPPAPAPSSPT